MYWSLRCMKPTLIPLLLYNKATTHRFLSGFLLCGRPVPFCGEREAVPAIRSAPGQVQKRGGQQQVAGGSGDRRLASETKYFARLEEVLEAL